MSPPVSELPKKDGKVEDMVVELDDEVKGVL